MTCFSCNQQLLSDKTGFIVCPHCGAVNISGTPDKPVYTHHSGVRVIPHNKSGSRLVGMRLPKKLTSITALLVALVCLLGVLAASFNIHLNQHHQTTSTPIAKRASTAKLKHTAQSVSKPTPQSIAIAPKTSTTPSAAPKPVAQSTAPQQSLSEIVATINQRLQPYGVTATLTPNNNAYTYSTWSTLTSSDINNLQQFSTYLTQEFSKYPTSLVVNSGLKTIGLVTNLKVSGGARAAAPAPSITGMLYDVNMMTNAGSAYAREVVSHEYWHYLDYRMQGSYNYADSQWSSCNTAGFNYGNGGASAYGGGYNGAFHPQPGFISQYATYAIEEDRAEMFGWLIYSPSSVKSLNDSGLNCKISRLTAIVHQLSPSMNF